MQGLFFLNCRTYFPVQHERHHAVGAVVCHRCAGASHHSREHRVCRHRLPQAFKLSVAYQGGIVVWVGIWAIYGKGVGAENQQSIAGFGAAFMTRVLVDPLVDIGILALDKWGTA